MGTTLTVWLLALSLLGVCTTAHRFVKFAYRGNISAEKWGDLSPDYFLCSHGIHQSPINIDRAAAVVDLRLKSLHRGYHPASAILVDNGFNVMLKYGNEVGQIIVDGKNYTLEQMHWHSPSEHTIDGVRYPMEMHLVHVSADKNISVVAVLYKYGHAEPFLYQLKKEMGLLTRELNRGNAHPNVTTRRVDTRALMHPSNRYYRYTGSLTTPPCTENIIWNVLGEVREISRKQAASLSSLLEDDCRNNSRPTQPLSGRRVLLYHGSI